MIDIFKSFRDIFSVNSKRNRIALSDEETVALKQTRSEQTDEINRIHTHSRRRVTENGVPVRAVFPVDITERELENTRRQQGILIKVLQIMQSADDIPQALNVVLDEIGRYAEVSRVHIFEYDAEKKIARNTYEWCSEETMPAIDGLQNIPVVYLNNWYKKFNTGGSVCVSDTAVLDPFLVKIMVERNIKSLLATPLISDGIHFGFVGFDECMHRVWEQSETDLLSALSHIISTSLRRHRVETSLRLSQQTMHTILDNINANIFAADFETCRILFANKNIKAEMGDDIEGRPCWEVLQEGKDAPCWFCPRSNLFDEKNRPVGSYRWEYRNDKTGKWYTNADTAIKWTDGRTVHLQCSSDITRRKKTEANLIRAKEKAEESDKLKSAFLANMSHEVRTPLNAITGFLNLLAADDLTAELRREYIGMANTAGRQLLQLMDDILDLAEMETGQLQIFPVPFPINELMNELQAFFETRMKTTSKSRITLLADKCGNIQHCVAFVDPLRLRQVLYHLMENAVKFTGNGYIRFGYRQSAPGMLEFTVEDSGIGLAPDRLEVIFESFRQAELGNNRLHGGTGLGLTLSRSLVRLMGGRMEVESVEGTGSSFRFIIPYVPVVPEDKYLFDEPPERKSSFDKPFTGKVILMIEPEEVKYLYYKKLLTATGASVIRFSCLHDPSDYIEQCDQINAVIVDMASFRIVDGEILEHIKSVRPELPVILIVPSLTEEYLPLIRVCRCDAVPEEPIDYKKLTEILEIHMT